MQKLRWRLLGVVPLVLSVAACNVHGHTHSPWQWGGGARAAPGWAVDMEGVSVHPMLSYTYLSFDGGHNDLLELGGQFRRQLGMMEHGLWLGGEAALANLRSNFDGFASSSTTGWSLTGLAGVPVGDTRWGINLYGGAGIARYGGSGYNVRGGIDLQPWFLVR